MRLAGGDELRDDSVDDITGREEVNEDLRQDVCQQFGLRRPSSPDTVEQDGHLLHHEHENLRVCDGSRAG